MRCRTAPWVRNVTIQIFRALMYTYQPTSLLLRSRYLTRIPTAQNQAQNQPKHARAPTQTPHLGCGEAGVAFQSPPLTRSRVRARPARRLP